MSFFSKTHERILRKFIFRDVDFVLIGGHAAVFYGVRRTTSDIDILVCPTLENGIRILKAFKDLKLETEDIHASDFTRPGIYFWNGTGCCGYIDIFKGCFVGRYF